MTEYFKLREAPQARPLDEWSTIAVELLGTTTSMVQGPRWRHRVIECGDGEPLILLHGIGGQAEVWARNMHNLARLGFHVYAADTLYHGFTDKTPWETTWQDNQVDALADLIRGLGLQWAHVEGESLGGGIALGFGLRYPEMAGKIILNTAVIRVDFKKKDFIQRPGGGLTLQTLSQESVAAPSVESFRRRMEWLVADPARMTDEMVNLRFRLYSFPEVSASMRLLYEVGLPDSRVPCYSEEDMLAFKPDVLVFWTDENPGKGPDYGEYCAGLFPDAKFYSMADAAHWAQWEKPEEHDQVLYEFILGR